jgi:EAL domain-containing protein (putative c-di-GMP-specific phosphodiesterase class I)
VVGLGKTLGMSITAEGVETGEQLRLVRQQGCDEAQGYLLSRPLSHQAACDLIGARPSLATVPEVEEKGPPQHSRARA